MKTGNTRQGQPAPMHAEQPQWSPVMKTGNTAPLVDRRSALAPASMEPGHEDREYRGGW